MASELRQVFPSARRRGVNPREAERVRLLNIERQGPRAALPPAAVSFYQNTQGPKATSSLSVFEGIGKDSPFSYSPAKFRVLLVPPDANGAVGETQYVQWVNTSFAVFDKQTGKLLYGPVDGQTLWQDFDRGSCENNNDGDPIVQYDKINKRWVLAQFSKSEFPNPRTGLTVKVPPFSQCIAVSETSDALGKYRRFRFNYDFFNDFPKVGVWPDGYYATFNMYSKAPTEKGEEVQSLGPLVCAYDRDVMLGLNTQRKASQQCIQLPDTFFSLLPADVDGTSWPTSGTPNYLLNLEPESGSINLWKFRVDWNNEANSRFEGPKKVSGVAPYEVACRTEGRGACIPQRGTEQLLESLSERLSYRVAYRRFPTHESFVFNHTVKTESGGTAIRWYEMRSPFDTPTIYQSGTFAPDNNSRWLASIAMDKSGNIGLGYTVSGTDLSPSIYFSGRRDSDPKGQLERETQIVNGGSQRCKLSNERCEKSCLQRDGKCSTSLAARWGDYTTLTIDPTDDCTMWYTAQYLTEDGLFDWKTKIAKIRFNSCR